MTRLDFVPPKDFPFSLGSRLTLGTAILNDGYGLFPGYKPLTQFEKSNFLMFANDLGILQFDTAPSYGAAEKLIGGTFNGDKKFRVTSKISRDSCISFPLLLQSVLNSLDQLGLTLLDSVLLHDALVLRGDSGVDVYKWMIEILEMGLVGEIGVSVYSAEEVLWVKQKFPRFSVFQLPESVMGRNEINRDELTDLYQQGNRLEVRSIFLQGLLLSNLSDLPVFFKPVKNVLGEFWKACKRDNILPLEACVLYAKSIPWASTVVVGAQDRIQLEEIVEALRSTKRIDFTRYPILPEHFLDPRNWQI
jgi:aryl-alcohol dehydrogenase-like predicted oxidoreductase